MARKVESKAVEVLVHVWKHAGDMDLNQKILEKILGPWTVPIDSDRMPSKAAIHAKLKGQWHVRCVEIVGKERGDG